MRYDQTSRAVDRSKKEPSAQGRWPANVLLDEGAAAMLDEQSGTLTSGKMLPTGTTAKRSVFGQNAAGGYTTMETYGDSGGASRFFYVAKANRSEREAGCESNAHPTVKPIALTTYVARLLLPPPGARPRRLLVPFSGSGSEVIGALLAGWDEVIGIEIDDEYRRIAEARIAHWVARGAPKPKATRKTPATPKRRMAWVQATLFDL
jgi:site-specific DNA-methyltransferase (adenine-specific)